MIPTDPHKRRVSRWLAVALLFTTLSVLSLTGCSGTWAWLWTRDFGVSVDTNHMIIGNDLTAETEQMFEGAVEYTGEAHSGTDIYYIGKAESENRGRIIVIDAGHQLKGSAATEPNGPGSEVMKAEVTWGATGVYTGEPEYELNLRVALLLRDELIRRGYSVVMIRETNHVDISNMERAQIANKYNAAAYIRIHANSWTDESMRGAMTICQSANNPYPSCAAHYEKSCLLSTLVLDEFCDQTGIQQLNRREMDDMTGTNWSEVPTTIVEMGFLSNTSDDRLMATDYFRQEAAIGIANGLDAYFAAVTESELESETVRGAVADGNTASDGTDGAAVVSEATGATTVTPPTDTMSDGKTDDDNTAADEMDAVEDETSADVTEETDSLGEPTTE